MSQTPEFLVNVVKALHQNSTTIQVSFLTSHLYVQVLTVHACSLSCLSRNLKGTLLILLVTPLKIRLNAASHTFASKQLLLICMFTSPFMFLFFILLKH